VTLYHGVLANLYGDDREEAVAVMDNDNKFDKWLIAFERKQKTSSTPPAATPARSRSKSRGKKVPIDKDKYLAAKTHGG
jgi:hypothetical protein